MNPDVVDVYTSWKKQKNSEKNTTTYWKPKEY